MKRILYAITIAMISLITLHASDIMVDISKLTDLKKLNVVLQDPALELKGAIEKPNSYILKLEARSPGGSQLLTAFLDKQTGELYIGSAYEKDGKQITFPRDAKVIKEGVSFSYGKGSKELYVVTDPECPYCSKFEKAVQGKLDDYTVHVILFPLSFHKKSPAMVEWILQGKDDAEKKERFEQLMLHSSKKYQTLIEDAKKPFVYSAEVEQIMSKATKAVMELNVRGTPSLFDVSFEPISPEVLLQSSVKRSVRK